MLEAGDLDDAADLYGEDMPTPSAITSARDKKMVSRWALTLCS